MLVANQVLDTLTMLLNTNKSESTVTFSEGQKQFLLDNASPDMLAGARSFFGDKEYADAVAEFETRKSEYKRSPKRKKLQKFKQLNLQLSSLREAYKHASGDQEKALKAELTQLGRLIQTEYPSLNVKLDDSWYTSETPPLKAHENALQEQRTKLGKQVSTLTQEIKTLEKAKERVSDGLETKDSQNAEVKERESTIKKMKQFVNTQRTELATDQQESLTKINTLEQTIKKQQQIADAQTTIIAKQQEKIGLANTTIAEQEKAIGEAKASVEQILTYDNGIQLSIEEQIQKNNERLTEINNALKRFSRGQIEVESSRIDKSNTEKQKLEAEKNTLTEQNTKLKKAKQKISKAEKAKANAINTRTKSKDTKLKAEIAYKNATKARETVENEELRNEKANYQQITATINCVDDLSVMQSKLEELRNQTINAKIKAQRLERSLAAKNQEIKDIKDSVSQDISVSSDEVTSVSSDEVTVAKITEIIKGTEGTEGLESNIDALEIQLLEAKKITDSKARTTKIGSLQNDLNKLKTLHKKLTKAQGKLKAAIEKRDSLQKSKEEADENVTKLDDDYDRKKGEIKTFIETREEKETYQGVGGKGSFKINSTKFKVVSDGYNTINENADPLIELKVTNSREKDELMEDKTVSTYAKEIKSKQAQIKKLKKQKAEIETEEKSLKEEFTEGAELKNLQDAAANVTNMQAATKRLGETDIRMPKTKNLQATHRQVANALADDIISGKLAKPTNQDLKQLLADFDERLISESKFQSMMHKLSRSKTLDFEVKKQFIKLLAANGAHKKQLKTMVSRLSGTKRVKTTLLIRFKALFVKNLRPTELGAVFDLIDGTDDHNDAEKQLKKTLKVLSTPNKELKLGTAWENRDDLVDSKVRDLKRSANQLPGVVADVHEQLSEKLAEYSAKGTAEINKRHMFWVKEGLAKLSHASSVAGEAGAAAGTEALELAKKLNEDLNLGITIPTGPFEIHEFDPHKAQDLDKILNESNPEDRQKLIDAYKENYPHDTTTAKQLDTLQKPYGFEEVKLFLDAVDPKQLIQYRADSDGIVKRRVTPLMDKLLKRQQLDQKDGRKKTSDQLCQKLAATKDGNSKVIAKLMLLEDLRSNDPKINLDGFSKDFLVEVTTEFSAQFSKMPKVKARKQQRRLLKQVRRSLNIDKSKQLSGDQIKENTEKAQSVIDGHPAKIRNEKKRLQDCKLI